MPECKAKPVCRWCRKEHLSTEHKCPIMDCPALQGVACMHCRKVCRLCDETTHYTEYRECTVLRNQRSTLPKYGKVTTTEGDNTTVNGINDRSRNWFQITDKFTRKTPVDEQLRDNLSRNDRTTIPKVKRSSSVPVGNRVEDKVETQIV